MTARSINPSDGRKRLKVALAATARLSAATYLHVVEQECLRRHLRFTQQRAQVLRLIVAARKPLKAYDVLERMIEANGETAPMTAYRVLDFLTEHGFIHRLASLNSYVACRHPEVQRSVPFLICERCNELVEIDGQNMVELLDSLAAAHSFQARAQTLEVLGECAGCRKSPNRC
jgi:Fur family zinc uptake transcriptional regulator